MNIRIRKSTTADTRTCDVFKVSKECLLLSSIQHINDVRQALLWFQSSLALAAIDHDHDKLSDIEGFHRDFLTKFKETIWWNKHRRINRHHLNMQDGVPVDVNLLDVLEHIADCVVAGMARSGNVYKLELPSELLQTAFANTVKILTNAIEIQPDL